VDEPTPDRKDWTWVLERPCESCGYDADALDRGRLGAAIRANAAAWRRLLGRGALVSARPPVAPGQSPVWSALEYGCHVRDVYQRMQDRLTRMLTEDEPSFADWDQDHAAIEGRYREQDPSRVGYDLAVTAGRVADEVDRIGRRGWSRVGTRSDGATFTVESLVRYLLHDVTHHAWDVEQGYEALTAEDEDDDDVAGAELGDAGEEPGDGSAEGGPPEHNGSNRA
jgi:hypothetical protein